MWNAEGRRAHAAAQRDGLPILERHERDVFERDELAPGRSRAGSRESRHRVPRHAPRPHEPRTQVDEPGVVADVRVRQQDPDVRQRARRLDDVEAAQLLREIRGRVDEPTATARRVDDSQARDPPARVGVAPGAGAARLGAPGLRAAAVLRHPEDDHERRLFAGARRLVHAGTGVRRRSR